MKTFILLIMMALSVSPANADGMQIDGPVALDTPASPELVQDKKQSNVIMGLQALIEGKIPAGTFCYASVETDTVTCRPMKADK
jgi:hypothetical protein